MTKGTDYKTLMWAYVNESRNRKRKYLRQCKDYNRKFNSNYRSEKVLKKLLRLDFHSLTGGI